MRGHQGEQAGPSKLLFDWIVFGALSSNKAMMAIDKAWQIARQRNQPFPMELLGKLLKLDFCVRCWLQADNACKELRNSWTGKWASLLCQGKYFGNVSHHHLTVGHTHEDIGCPKKNFSPACSADGCFSILTSCLNAERDLQTPRDVQRHWDY